MGRSVFKVEIIPLIWQSPKASPKCNISSAAVHFRKKKDWIVIQSHQILYTSSMLFFDYFRENVWRFMISLVFFVDSKIHPKSVSSVLMVLLQNQNHRMMFPPFCSKRFLTLSGACVLQFFSKIQEWCAHRSATQPAFSLETHRRSHWSIISAEFMNLLRSPKGLFIFL